MKYRETPDVDRERMPTLQGVCKDCGNGTLNNELNPAFELNGDEGFAGGDTLVCNRCGSDHIDVLS
jgi:hypothetical protein